jgi:hypothetical protein
LHLPSLTIVLPDNLAIAGENDRLPFLIRRKAAGIDRIAVHLAIGNGGAVVTRSIDANPSGAIAVIIEEIDRWAAVRIVTFPGRSIDNAVVAYRDVANGDPSGPEATIP